MPAFTFTSPEGKSYTVNGPEGATKEQAFGILQQQLGTQSQPANTPERMAMQAKLDQQMAEAEQAQSGLDQAQIGRHIGRIGAAAAEGGASVATLPLDLLAAGGNFVMDKLGIGKKQNIEGLITGKEAQSARIPSASEAFSSLIRSQGAVSETPAERVQEDVVRGATGSLGLSGAAKQLLAKGVGAGAGIGGKVIRGIASGPGTQAAAAATGAAASGLTREEGGGQLAQLAAGAVGGLGGSTALGIGRGAGSAARTVINAGGQREVIAGNILRDAAENPQLAMRSLENAQEIIPGSLPTAAEAARDPGVAYLQARMRALGSDFAGRESAQNQARQVFLDRVAGGGLAPRIEKAIERREKVTTKLRDAAYSEASGKRVNGGAVVADIDRLLSDPENAGKSVQAALKDIRKQIAGKSSSSEAGGMIVEETPTLSDIKSLYAVRKEINRVLEGRYVGADESILRYAGGQLGKVKESIDNAISEVAPSWRKYLTKYSEMSKPINQAETLKEIRERTALSAPDIRTGRDFISQPKWRNVVSKAMPELSKTMTPRQMEQLQRVSADLDRGAAATNSSNIRTRGSDTAANMVANGQMTMAHVIGRVLGSKGTELPAAVSAIAKPFSFLLSQNDQQIRQLIGEAMLDPALAAQLMRKGSPEAAKSLAKSLAGLAGRGSAGGTIGAEANQ